MCRVIAAYANNFTDRVFKMLVVEQGSKHGRHRDCKSLTISDSLCSASFAQLDVYLKIEQSE
jgi:hypothetical protein